MRSGMEGTCGRTEANLTTELLVSNSGWLPVVPLVIVTIQSNPIHKNKKKYKNSQDSWQAVMYISWQGRRVARVGKPRKKDGHLNISYRFNEFNKKTHCLRFYVMWCILHTWLFGCIHSKIILEGKTLSKIWENLTNTKKYNRD